jgi:hypothetical protein
MMPMVSRHFPAAVSERSPPNRDADAAVGPNARRIGYGQQWEKDRLQALLQVLNISEQEVSFTA